MERPRSTGESPGRGAIAEFNGAHSFHHCGEGESGLHPREQRTNTEMNAVAEGNMAAILTRDIEIVRRIRYCGSRFAAFTMQKTR